MPKNRRSVAFTLIELLVAIGLASLLIAILLPTLNRARESAMRIKMASDERQQKIAADIAAAEAAATAPGPGAAGQPPTKTPAPRKPLANITSFGAEVVLTPRLSVGTAQP